jgi:hypothetical protein
MQQIAKVCAAMYAFTLLPIPADAGELRLIPYYSETIDQAGKEASGAVHGKIEEIIAGIVDEANRVRDEYNSKEVPVFSEAPLDDPTMLDLKRFELNLGNHVFDLEGSVYAVQEIQDRMQTLDAFAQGTEEAFDRTAYALLPAAPTESYSYFQRALVDAVELQFAVNEALGAVNSYRTKLDTAIVKARQNHSIFSANFETLRLERKRLGLCGGTVKKPQRCKPQSDGTGGIGGFSGGVAQ